MAMAINGYKGIHSDKYAKEVLKRLQTAIDDGAQDYFSIQQRLQDALKEMKAKGGPFEEAAKMRLPRDIAAKMIDQAEWLGRAKKYGVIN